MTFADGFTAQLKALALKLGLDLLQTIDASLLFIDANHADCGQETHKAFTPVVLGSPGPELVAQEGELLVLVVPSSVVSLQ